MSVTERHLVVMSDLNRQMMVAPVSSETRDRLCPSAERTLTTL